LFKLARALKFGCTTADSSTLEALQFLLEHERNRSESLEVGAAFEVTEVVSEKWWSLVTGGLARNSKMVRVNRKHFEVCVFTRLLWD
jgi:hypothetical protein